MPKKYPIEVRLFATQKRNEGRSWEEVGELLKQQFNIESAPSRRQMIKWVNRPPTAADVVKEIDYRLPGYAPELLNNQRESLTGIIAEGMKGKDFGIITAKWMFSEMKSLIGIQRLRAAWSEFNQEQELMQQDDNAGMSPEEKTIRKEWSET